MKEDHSSLIIFLAFILSIIAGTLLWDKINLPYNNPQEIIGNYSKFKVNMHTETLRYLIYISLPIITFFLLFIYLKKDKCVSFQDIFSSRQIAEYKKNQLLTFCLYAFIFVAVIEFFTIEFSLMEMDYFHEGLATSGAFNYLATNGLWKSSYLNFGLFYDILNAKTAWAITGQKTLGAWRFYNIFFGFITEILIIIFCYKLSKIFNFEKNIELIFFLILCFYSIYLNREISLGFQPLRPRDITLLLFLIFSLNLFTTHKRNYIYCFLIGCLSIFSLLWSIDRGAYINATLLALITLLLFKNKKYQTFFIFFGLIFSWSIFYFIVDYEEFIAFIFNSISIFKSSDFFNGAIYPTPFSFTYNEHAARGTKNLLIIIINGVLIISSLLNKENKIPNGTKLFLLIFYILAFVSYKSALSRSDGSHMRQSIFLQFILLTNFFLYYLLNFLRKFDIKKKLDLLFNRFLLVIVILFLIIMHDQLNLKDFNNLKNFKDRYISYINLDDSFFLSDNYNKLVKKLKKLHKDEECFLAFAYEHAIPFLLKKKPCTKFYNIYAIGSKKNQYDFINEIKLKKPKYVLIDGPYKKFADFPPEEKFPYITEFLFEYYLTGEEFLSWKILYLKN